MYGAKGDVGLRDNVAVLLLSGGLDSSVSLGLAAAKSKHVYALTVDYGQLNYCETFAARVQCTQYQNVSHHCVSVPLLKEFTSLTSKRHAIDRPSTYIPGRNTILIACAFGLSESVGAQEIWTGISAGSEAEYPDCKQSYIEAWNTLLREASGFNDPVRLVCPLLHLKRVDIVQIGIDLEIDLGLTMSCLTPSRGRICGRCSSCLARRYAFARHGLSDPSAEITFSEETL